MPISRGQMPRQLYGLGSFVKSIGKAVKGAVKGVTSTVKKNPVLALAALNFAPALIKGGASTFFGGKNAMFGLPSFLTGGTISPNLMDEVALTGKQNIFQKALSAFPGGKFGAGIAGASLIGGMLTPKAQEDVEALRQSGDRGLLQGYLRRYYGNLNPNASAEEIEEFVRTNSAEGGRIGYARGDTAEQNAMQASGIMGLPLNENPAGVTELDLRETGGFIPPVGVKEKADDIPAMLSNNEFVFTADAVRGMGGGDVNKGAQRLYDQMKMLEKGGRV